MARDGVFFRPIAAVHPRFRTPARAIALQAVLAAIFVMVGTFDEILGYFIFVTVFFLGLTVVAMFVLRRREGVGPFTTPGYPATPLFFLLLVGVLLALLGGNRPIQAALGVGVVALGIPMYYLLFRGPLNSDRMSSP
jgi:APA family basic amino acid/polyamine antiporter